MFNRSLPIVVPLTLYLVLAALGGISHTGAQDATPSDPDIASEGGVSVRLLAYGETDTAELVAVRITVAPGGSAPGDANSPSSALISIESGTLTVRMEGSMIVWRAAAFDLIEATPDAAPEAVGAHIERIPAGEEIQLGPGDSTLFPAYVAGEFRNEGPEPVVLLLFSLEPTDEASPVASPHP